MHLPQVPESNDLTSLSTGESWAGERCPVWGRSKAIKRYQQSREYRGELPRRVRGLENMMLEEWDLFSLKKGRPRRDVVKVLRDVKGSDKGQGDIFQSKVNCSLWPQEEGQRRKLSLQQRRVTWTVRKSLQTLRKGNPPNRVPGQVGKAQTPARKDVGIFVLTSLQGPGLDDAPDIPSSPTPPFF